MNPFILTFTAALGLIVPGMGLPAQETVAVRAGSLIVAPGREIPEGVLLVRQGHVDSFGPNLPIPAGARVIDHSDSVIAPGLIDLWTQASVKGETSEPAQAWTPGHRVTDALDLHQPIWARLAREGVTAVLVAPEPSQVGGGLACLVKTGPNPRIAMAQAAFQLSLREEARQRERPPTSLAGQVDLIRRSFGALEGKQRMLLLCDGAHETFAAARLARELGLQGFLLGELAHRDLAALLSGSGLGAALAPADPEGPAWRLELPLRLAAAGVPVAFCSGSPDPAPLTLRLQPARAVRLGMDRATALASVTRTPAALLGLDHTLGTLLKGRDADFLVLDGHPLDPGARIRAVYIDGKRVAFGPQGIAKEARP